MSTVTHYEAKKAVLAVLRRDNDYATRVDAQAHGKEFGVIVPAHLRSDGEFINFDELKLASIAVHGSFNPVYESDDIKTSFTHTGIEIGEDKFVAESFADLTVAEMTYLVSVSPSNIRHIMKSYENLQDEVVKLRSEKALLQRQVTKLQDIINEDEYESLVEE